MSTVRHLTKADYKFLEKCARVECVRNCFIGYSEFHVKKGTIGYILGHNIKEKSYLIHWDHPRQHKNDWRCGAQVAEDFVIVGRGVV